eukprot:5739364-Pyramimonas_sp.AAC.1
MAGSTEASLASLRCVTFFTSAVPTGQSNSDEATLLPGASVEPALVQPPVPATSEAKPNAAILDVASVAHVLDGPGLPASLNASGSHLVAETWVIEEALDDIAARVVQRSLILSLAHHAAHVR